MPQTSYPHDIFISYARKDNEALHGEDGWVTQFKDYLENWLIKKRHLKDITIWMDDEDLSGNAMFDEAIQKTIQNTALFFVLHSHNYQDSDYCRKELDWFVKHNPNSLIVNQRSRIFNLLINNISHENWSKDLAGTAGFTLHDAEAQDQYGYPTDPRAVEFNQQMRKLVEDIAKALQVLPKAEQATEQTNNAEPSHKPQIFLAEVADTLRPFRKRLIQEIGDQAIVLPNLPPPFPAQDHQQAVDQQLQQTHLSIHLLDQWQGRQMDDGQHCYPRAQAELAMQKPHSSIIWIPDHLHKDDMEDEQQAQWLHELEHDQRQQHHFQFVRSNRQSLIDQIKQIIEQQLAQNQQAKTDDELRFLIDTHVKDQMSAFELAAKLSGKQIKVGFNQETDDPVQSLENFENAVKEVQNLIIMFGEVAPNWLQGRIQTALKVIANQWHESVALQNIWVCLLPASRNTQTSNNFPPILNIQYLDNSGSSSIDETIIETLLQQSQNKANGGWS